jgi:ligand-binding sensor domain-containing protein/two-component sensor histidine kinase
MFLLTCQFLNQYYLINTFRVLKPICEAIFNLRCRNFERFLTDKLEKFYVTLYLFSTFINRHYILEFLESTKALTTLKVTVIQSMLLVLNTNRTIRLIAIIICMMVMPPVNYSEGLPTKSYKTGDGLAHNRVKKILRDSQGFLWFGTLRGLSKFDGYRFNTYGPEHGLLDPYVTDILETKNGMYWVATDGGGLFLFNPKGVQASEEVVTTTPHLVKTNLPLFKQYSIGNSRFANQINVLYQDANGNILVGTDDGMFCIEHSQDIVKISPVHLNVQISPSKYLWVRAFLEDKEGSLWIGTSHGLIRRLSNGHIINYINETSLNPFEHIRALLKDHEGRLWVGYNGGLLVLKPEPISEVQDKTSVTIRSKNIVQSFTPNKIELPSGFGESCNLDKLFHKGARALYQHDDERIWASGVSGIGEFKGNNYRFYSAKNGVTGDAINSFAEDQDGNTWIGTDTGGALKILRNGFTSYGEPDGITDTNIKGVFEDLAGTLYTVSYFGDIHYFDESKFTKLNLNLPSSSTSLVQAWTYKPFQDHTGEWWFASYNGIYRFPRAESVTQLAHAKPKKLYTTKDGLANNNVNKMFEDSRGDLWISMFSRSKEVLSRWERSTDTFHNYSDKDGLSPFKLAISFAEDASGNVWIGFEDGQLVRYKAGRFTQPTKELGLSVGDICTLYFSAHSGTLWFGTSEGGLGRINNPNDEHPQLVMYTTANGLHSNHVDSITEDHLKQLFIGTNNGIDIFDPKTGFIEHYSDAHGLSNIEVSKLLFDRKGTLWVGTLNNLFRFEHKSNVVDASPVIRINEVIISGIKEPLSELGETAIDIGELEYSHNNIQIGFSSINFATGDNIQYQYKLEGIDTNWGSMVNNRTVIYAKLKPGSYCFHVKAVNSKGLFSTIPAKVCFNVLPAFWLRWWFITLLAAIVVSVIYLIYRYRIKQLLALEAVKSRIAIDLHDDIGSSLSQIAILSEVVHQQIPQEEQSFTRPLSLIAATSRELVDSMSDIVWSINPQKDHLSDLTQRMRRFSSEMFSARNIDFSFISPDIEKDLRIESDVRREIYLIFKECINNIARHSRCTEVSIEFYIDGGWLILKLKDNGCSFDVERKSHGNGLMSMRQRAKLIKGFLEIFSDKGIGTIVTLRVPLSKRFLISPVTLLHK